MLMRVTRNFLISASVIVLLATVSSCKKKDDSALSGSNAVSTTGDIVVGALGPTTGAEATYGVSAKNGIEMAFEKINGAGGVAGRKLRMVFYDDQGKPEEAAAVMTRLITQDKVVAVLGEIASSRSLAMAPIAQTHKVPMISHTSTNPKVTEIGDYIFRVCFIDPFQGSVVATFVSDTLHSKKAAVLRDLKSDYSVGLAQFFKEKYVGSGGQIVAEEAYSSGDIDFKAQLTAIRATKPDFVFVPGYYTDVGLIIRQGRELGIVVPFGGGDARDSDKLFEIGGKSMEGTYFSNHYSPDSEDPIVKGFVAEYKQKYGAVPDTIAALAYDSAGVLAEAMKRARSLSGADLRDAIAHTNGYMGATGKITLDAKRNPTKSAVIIKIENGKRNYLKTINPSG